MGASIKWFNKQHTINRIVNNKDVGLFTAETCARYMNPYVPMDTGMLSQNYITEPWKVTYTQPYARYQFLGTEFNHNLEHHPLATARWDQATQASKSMEIAMEIEEYIRRR